MEDLVPFQVQLERRQHRHLKRLAETRGRSMGSLVRESVEAYLSPMPAEEDPLLGIIGVADDRTVKAHGDVGIEHDAYLADAYADESKASAPPPRLRRRIE
ncbi:hypothetical protein BH23CHL8_BH23CHL8_16300 [soil metagenome]